MRLFSVEDCKLWLTQRNRSLPSQEGPFRCRIATTDERAFPLAQWIASRLTYREPVLLWITEHGIWPTSENWHLYYAIRRSSGDTRFLDEAPGHLFLNFEMEELTTILQIALLNGWGGYVLTGANSVNVFFSHDEYMVFSAEQEANLALVQEFWKAE